MNIENNDDQSPEFFKKEPNKDITDDRQKYRIMVSKTDNETLGTIVGWVSKYLDTNPRRVKQFINLFRLKVLIANETGLFDSDNNGNSLTLEQLAKFVVITLKWPLFLLDLENDLDLLNKVAFVEQEQLSQNDWRAERWRKRGRLINLLEYGCNREIDGPNYSMGKVSVENLFQVCPRVRGTDIWTPQRDENENENTYKNVEEEIENPSTEPIKVTDHQAESEVKIKTTNAKKRQPSPNIDVKTVRIFLASTSELKSDREQFEIFIHRENRILNKRGFFIDLQLWENFIDAMSQTRLQDEYNNAIKESDIFVSLFFKRVSRYTIEEFETAFSEFKRTGKPFVYTYFKDAGINIEQVTDENINLLDFKRKLEELGHFITTYKNIEGLQLHFKNQLEKILPNL